MNIAYKDDAVLKQRIEKINGKIYMMSPRPRVDHNRICTNISREFSLYLKGKRCEAFSDGVDVYLDDKNRFVPDVMIVCNPDIVQYDGIHGTPDLVVEVLSPSTAMNDRERKKIVYERAGVREYWIVSPLEKTVEVYLSIGGEFVLDYIYFYLSDEELAENDALPDDDSYKVKNYNDSIKVSLYDDLFVKLSDIFDRVS